MRNRSEARYQIQRQGLYLLKDEKSTLDRKGNKYVYYCNITTYDPFTVQASDQWASPAGLLCFGVFGDLAFRLASSAWQKWAWTLSVYLAISAVCCAFCAFLFCGADSSSVLGDSR